MTDCTGQSFSAELKKNGQVVGTVSVTCNQGETCSDCIDRLIALAKAELEGA